MQGVVSGWVFDSNASAMKTMRRMAGEVREARKHPAVVRLSNEIVAAVKPRDTASQVGAIKEYMNRHFRFVNNPVGLQLVRDGVGMVGDILARGFTQGACDDAAILVGAFAESNGLLVRFRALAFYRPDAPFSHVIADVFDGGGWIPLDVTKPPEMNSPPEPTRTLTLEVH